MNDVEEFLMDKEDGGLSPRDTSGAIVGPKPAAKPVKKPFFSKQQGSAVGMQRGNFFNEDPLTQNTPKVVSIIPSNIPF